ncbi:hypothetical protein Cgig2_002079 [Carnegiea gigantea]|uniref:Uncharacterized protein n=1 Tax=Carnegiea gigantea TaxID=171969 RepID=A0A9Q1Q7T3_9CARY|nr:hypothetical protein Cgig2_002079 [Carnegiea gigantea]
MLKRTLTHAFVTEQRGELKRPDHADLRYKCRTYARLLQHMKSLDKNSLRTLRKAYCASLNLLLRKEVREFANELRASIKAAPPRNPTVWTDAGAGQNVSSADTSAVSEAYAKTLTVFIPLLVDESSFFAHFMCFEVPTHSTDADDHGNLNDDDNSKAVKNSADLAALNEYLQELLDGIQRELRVDLRSLGGYLRSGGPWVSGSLSRSIHPYPPVVQPDVAGAVRLSFRVPLSVSSDLLLIVDRFLQPSLSEYALICASSNFLYQCGGRPILSLPELCPPENLPPATFQATRKSPDFLFSSVSPLEQADLRVSGRSLSGWGASGGLSVGGKVDLDFTVDEGVAKSWLGAWWLVQFRVPEVVIGGPPEVRWTLGFWEQPVVRFASRPLAFRVSLGCFFKFVRRWRDSVFLVTDLGWPTVTVTAGEFRGGFLIAGEFSGHWNLVGNSPSHFFRVRISRSLS